MSIRWSTRNHKAAALTSLPGSLGSAGRLIRLALVGALGAAAVVGGATAVVAVNRPITANECLTNLAAPLIAERGLDGVQIGVDERLTGGTMAQVEMTSPTVVRIAVGTSTWCGGRYEPDLRAVISHELGHVEQYRLGADPVHSALLRQRLQGAYGNQADALEGAANCAAEIQLDVNISAYVSGPAICTPDMLAAARSIRDGRWPA